MSNYDVPLVGYDGKVVVSKGMIWLPVQTGEKVVSVNFIVVDTFSPYTTILVRPWPYAIEVVSLTLHVKLKYPTGDKVVELVGCQVVAR